MTRRPDDKRLRRLILGILFIVLAIGAAVLLGVIAPLSDDPEGVGRLLGGVAGALGVAGVLMVLVGLMTPRLPRKNRRQPTVPPTGP